MIIITEKVLDTLSIIKSVEDNAAGAIDVFIGTVRNKTSDKSVSRLDYESYDAMATKEIQKIIDLAQSKWPIRKVAVHHRKGTLKIGAAAVVIAVSTPHRKESFEACQYIIDNLKKTVPIWKKEIFDDGEIWASAHP